MNPEIQQYIDKLIEDSPKGCGLEGVGSRPEDCPNNPWRHPDNYRPSVCFQCPGNPEIWKVADNKNFPSVYIQLKQGTLVEGLHLMFIQSKPTSSPTQINANQQEL